MESKEEVTVSTNAQILVWLNTLKDGQYYKAIKDNTTIAVRVIGTKIHLSIRWKGRPHKYYVGIDMDDIHLSQTFEDYWNPLYPITLVPFKKMVNEN